MPQDTTRIYNGVYHDTYIFDLGYVVEAGDWDNVLRRGTNAVLGVLVSQWLSHYSHTVELRNEGGGLVGPSQTTKLVVVFSGHLGMVEAAWFTILLERALQLDRVRR